jgi:hypothetical protein
MAVRAQACCSSPFAMGYWCSVSLVAWGVLGFVGIFWYPLHASSATTICFAVAIGCVVNWVRNRTLHCGITGPLFLIAGVLFLLSGMDVLAVSPCLIWAIVAIFTGVAFPLEWRYAARTRRRSDGNKLGEHS